MKNIYLILTLLILTLGISAQAETPQTTQTPVPAVTQQRQPTAEELQQAKETLKALVATEQTQTGKQQATQTKSVVDVLDKGVDVFAGYVTTLEGVVSKYAPEVWRIMIMQQYSKAIGYPLFWGLMILVVFIIYGIVRKWYGIPKGDSMFKEQPDESCVEAYGFRIVLSCALLLAGAIFSVVFLNYLTEGIMIGINPEFYALKDIINLLR